MTPERWRRIEALYHAALTRRESERSAFLAEASADDDALRCEVESLLAQPAEHFLAGPAVAAAQLPSPRSASVAVGSRLGVYQLEALLGIGGMGTVYRARDTRLGREVALKILPHEFTADPDRLVRFGREARILAALNHPHVATLYGIEETDGVHALVMELVEGETLADRLARGPMSIEEMLPVAKQIAEALESAHEQGIIHRDLKPANIKLRPDGTVKVLDFGLAKAFVPGSSGAVNATVSPTLSLQVTQAGIILGTAAYMAPEQARGNLVDRRADIWAFGVVLFEMLANCRPFAGDDTPTTLAAVMMKEPDWSLLPVRMPTDLRRLLHRCLDKDPRRRLQAIGDARVQIEDLLAGTRDDVRPTSWAARRPLTVAAAAVVLLVGSALAVLSTRALLQPTSAKMEAVRFAVMPSADQPLAIDDLHPVAISPDGTRVVYVTHVGGETRLMVRAIDQLDPVSIGGIANASSPFFSPDGRWIGYFTGAFGGELKKVSIIGGPSTSLGRTRGFSGGASWGPDDTIVFATIPRVPGVGLLQVSAAGGEPTVLTTPAAGENHLFPSVLPGARAILFTITSGDAFATAQVAVLDRASGQHKILIRNGRQAEYIQSAADSSGGGYLVYVVGNTLRAVHFDRVKLEVLGEPVAVVESVMNGRFSVSRHGALVYVPGGAAAATPRSLVWLDRHGHETPIPAPPRNYIMPRLSPKGERLAVSIVDRDVPHIWIWDFAHRTLSRLTDGPNDDWYGVWTPDGTRIAFGSVRPAGTGMFWQAADNPATLERLTMSSNRQGPSSVTPDGTRLIFNENMPKTGWDQRMLRLPSGANGSPTTEPLVQTPAAELLGEVSPDGHWFAYQSDESGQYEIWVRPFPNVGAGHWQISSAGGISPAWARNGQELFFLDINNAVISVPIHTASTFSADLPTKLFDWPYVRSAGYRTYDVSPDGQRFLMIKDNAVGDQRPGPASVVVVLNWQEDLKQRVPTR